ncbi:DHHC palmitoyltransferase-domain-containing protein [Radiomyces spectabilis]|uniref:DHHC palmitoyltransferase-domain-containing protein n=1 Tax=Radiomyces spectabilis TaxID=64574 RepID=UPI002220026F|nr:DHHC palmitoyltransferase-domain-containing protein [Radiomyces spectabilis]KAI8379534.1 DHHC palmitoyltransferase-domain-containing protein [Radiomyces spectabilis]
MWSSRLGMTIVGLALPVIVLAILVYTWYAYVFEVCVSTLMYNEPHRLPQLVVFLVFGCFFWLLSILSYFRVLFSCPGSPVKELPPCPISNQHTATSDPSQLPRYCFSPSLFDLSRMRAVPLVSKTSIMSPAVSTSQPNGRPRYCNICDCLKPDRSHHCKDCNKCILKMDHHCPWINGCVGHGNYKFFLLFVLYTAIYALWVLATTIPVAVRAMTVENVELNVHWIVLVVLAAVFGLMLTGFAVMHGYYVYYNRTTIESLATRPQIVRIDFDASGSNFEVISLVPEERIYDLGPRANWQAVMGKQVYGWFIPLYGGIGDGCIYPYSPRSYKTIVDSAIYQRASRAANPNRSNPSQSNPPVHTIPHTSTTKRDNPDITITHEPDHL